MNCYYFGEQDQAKASWVLFDIVKPAKRECRVELPPEVFRFFGPQPEGEMRMKPEFLPICCKECGRYDEDAVFDVGFREPVTIRVRGDFTHTQDRVFIVSEKFLKVVRKANVRGYEAKPVGKSGWYAFHITERVDYSEGVMQLVEPTCPACKRARTTTGMFKRQSELSLPKHANTFFTTKRGWPSMLWDRWIFATEDVVLVLKAAGIAGGYCNRLWTEEESRVAATKPASCRPPRSTIFLNGKAGTPKR